MIRIEIKYATGWEAFHTGVHVGAGAALLHAVRRQYPRYKFRARREESDAD